MGLLGIATLADFLHVLFGRAFDACDLVARAGLRPDQLVDLEVQRDLAGRCWLRTIWVNTRLPIDATDASVAVPPPLVSYNTQHPRTRICAAGCAAVSATTVER